jgi:hypothetical protein
MYSILIKNIIIFFGAVVSTALLSFSAGFPFQVLAEKSRYKKTIVAVGFPLQSGAARLQNFYLTNENTRYKSQHHLSYHFPLSILHFPLSNSHSPRLPIFTTMFQTRIHTILFMVVGLLFANTLFAQEKNKISFDGYAEIYFAYDSDMPDNKERASFLYNHKRHRDLNLNLAFARMRYNGNRVRFALAPMIGTYPRYNLAAEREWLRFVYEANLGIRILKKRDLWLEAGVFPSHIGFESAVGADCATAGRSLVAENSPYYEAGSRLSYKNTKGTISAALLYLNGWQRMERPAGITRPSFGGQFTWQPNPKVLFNYSNFIGTDKPDSLNATRLYHNVYLQYSLDSNWTLIAGFDLGRDKDINGRYANWYTPVGILSFKASEKIKLGTRVEYFHDPNEVLINTGTVNGFRTLGISANFDYSPFSDMLFRVECRGLRSKDNIFDRNRDQENISLLLTASYKF